MTSNFQIINTFTDISFLMHNFYHFVRNNIWHTCPWQMSRSLGLALPRTDWEETLRIMVVLLLKMTGSNQISLELPDNSQCVEGWKTWIDQMNCYLSFHWLLNLRSIHWKAGLILDSYSLYYRKKHNIIIIPYHQFYM